MMYSNVVIACIVTIAVDLAPEPQETCTEFKRKILASFCPGLVLFN